jgi:hypothetical protein
MNLSTDCGLKYSVIRDPIPEERKIVEIEDEEAYISQIQVEEDIRIFGDRPIPLDLEETDNPVILLGGSTSNSPDLARLSSRDHLSYGVDSVGPRDLDSTKELKILQDSSGSLDQLTDENAMLDSLQAKKSTPLDAWLSKLPTAGTASDNIPTVPSLDSEDLEAKGIEQFRNVHVKDVESIGQIQGANSERACTGNSQEIIFSARIFYRNIRDRYPHMPKYLARRLAKANIARSDRLGFSRVEQGESSPSEDFEDEDSEDSVLNHEKMELEASPETVDPEAVMGKLFESTENASLDADPFTQAMDGVDPVNFRTLRQKLQGAARSMFKKEEADEDISYWSGEVRLPSPHSSASRSSTMNSSLHGCEEGKMLPSACTWSVLPGSESIDGSTGEPVLQLPPPPVELGTRQSFACDICGCTVNALRRRDWT